MINLTKIKFFLLIAIVFSFVIIPNFSFAVVNQNPFPINFPGSPGNTTGPYNPDNGVIIPPPEYQSCREIISGIGGFLCDIQLLLNSIIPVLILLGVVYFVWGVVQYFIKDDEEAKKNGRDRIIFGIIALSIIIGVWGLITLVVNTFGFGSISAPSVPSGGGSCSLSGNPTLRDLLCYFARILNTFVVPLIFALTIVVFVWGVVSSFIINAGEVAKREQGKLFIFWSIVALAIMLSLWGLVAVLGGTFGLDTSVLPQVSP